MNRCRGISVFIVVLLVTVLLNGCDSQTADQASRDQVIEPDHPAYVVMDQSLDPLIERFNAGVGTVRQVFLVGPTCGICLRGMADLNDEHIAELQGDDRLQTLVVHLPTLGAREEHVAPTIPLLDGPNVHHFWDSTGILGRHYQELLDVPMYVWDIWFIYDPDARWSGGLPPEPEFFQHQLAGFPLGERLDKEEFAAAARSALAKLPIEPKPIPAIPDSERLADGTVIPVVAQPRGVAVQQHIMGRGGYRRLKTIQSIEYQGDIEFPGNRLPIEVYADRDQGLERMIGTGDEESTGLFSEVETRQIGSGDRGLDWDLEVLLFDGFDFDGPLVEWPDKGHELTMNGMRKAGNVLAWDLGLIESGGRQWQLLVDSHSGDIVRATLLDSDGVPQIHLEFADFREVEGVRLPFRKTYRSPGGTVLATEYADSVQVTFRTS